MGGGYIFFQTKIIKKKRPDGKLTFISINIKI